MNPSHIRVSLINFFVALTLTFALLTPALSIAQSQGELKTTIRAAIMADPRSQSMSEAEVDAMVEALANQAESQGVTSEDIRWTPAQPVAQSDASSAATPCGSMPMFLCNLNTAFGFSGDDVTIPVILGIGSALLLFVIGVMLERHWAHRHLMQKLAEVQNAPVSASPPPPPNI